jgi:hypothetical protein
MEINPDMVQYMSLISIEQEIQCCFRIKTIITTAAVRSRKPYRKQDEMPMSVLLSPFGTSS